VELEDSDPDDDYETTQKAKAREFQRSRRFHPSATRTEDEDEEENEEFLQAVEQGEIQSEDETRGGKKVKKQGGKSKGKSKAAAGDSDADDADDADAETRRSGPFSKELKKEADELGAEFKKDIAALAQKYGKDPQAVHRYLGSLTEAHREKNAWNLYQSWKSAPDGGNDVMPDDSKFAKSIPRLHDLTVFASGTAGVERQGGR
jgi:hypothetical protein